MQYVSAKRDMQALFFEISIVSWTANQEDLISSCPAR